MLSLSSCELKFRNDNDDAVKPIEVQRYDRLESIYLTTGDFSALQQMETGYPMETRTLIENILKLGSVNDAEINNKFLAFFQDTTLQVIISDVGAQYANMDDINEQLNDAFRKLTYYVPGLPVPQFYAQIGALDQSIVVGDDRVGISLDYEVRFYEHFHSRKAEKARPDRRSLYGGCGAAPVSGRPRRGHQAAEGPLHGAQLRPPRPAQRG